MDGRERGFWWATLAIVAVAVVIRVAFALLAHDAVTLPGDAAVFRETARHLAAGDGYSDRVPGSDGLVPSSAHPPAFPTGLAVLDVAGVESERWQRVAVGGASALGVGVVALLGRRLGSARVGLAAGAIAAVHPLWFQPGGVLMSEALVLCLVPLLLYLAVGVRRRPTWWGIGATGLCGGALVLTRTESALLVAALALALLVLDRRPWRVRFGALALLGASVAVVVVPWMGRNLARVDSFNVSTNLGVTLAGSYCEEVFDDSPRHGAWHLTCAYRGVEQGLEGREGAGPPAPAEIDAAGREAAGEFAREHLAEVPGVAVSRVGRLWGVAHLGDQLAFDIAEGRHETAQRAGQYLHWVLLAAAVVGAVVLPRRWWPDWVLVALPALTTTLSAAAIYGSTRMRAAVEPTLALFAAVALVWAWRRLAGRPMVESGRNPEQADRHRVGATP